MLIISTEQKIDDFTEKDVDGIIKAAQEMSDPPSDFASVPTVDHKKLLEQLTKAYHEAIAVKDTQGKIILPIPSAY